MNDMQFRAFLDLMMRADPWPAGPDEHTILTNWANDEAKRHGYLDWLDAYHNHTGVGDA